MEKSDIKQHFEDHQEEISSRLKEFKKLRDSPEQRKFKELVFVILTSQTDAEKAWSATEKLGENDLIINGDKKEISQVLEQNDINYPENKSGYIVENRETLSQPTLVNPEKELKISDKIDEEDLDKSRTWFAENMKGMGLKGASHFLRNIGYGNEFAIVSGHIVNILCDLKLLENSEPPENREKYLEIENKVRTLSQDLEIGVKELDLVLWSMRTGKVFK